MQLTVGIDEVGYGPKLGPLVLAAACARRPLKASVRIADSKKIFSQARGVGSLEPAVLGFVPAATFGDLLGKLGTRLPEQPWYRKDLPLPGAPPLSGLTDSLARLVDPSEFNQSTREQNKSDFLFEIAASLINRVRASHPEQTRFLVGKQGGAGTTSRASKGSSLRRSGPSRKLPAVPPTRSPAPRSSSSRMRRTGTNWWRSRR